MTDNNSFILYTSYFEILEDLTDEQMGKLFRAILEYKATKKQPTISTELSVAFKFIKNQLDLDEEKYNDKVAKQKENGKKGGAPKGNQNAVKNNPKQPKTTQNNPTENSCFVETTEYSNLQNKKAIDPYINNIKTYFTETYSDVFGNKPRLTFAECNKLCELNADIENFKDSVAEVLEKTKKLKFNFTDGKTFKPEAHWLLKDDNYVKVLDGVYDSQAGEKELSDYEKQMQEDIKRERKELEERIARRERLRSQIEND